MELWKFFAERAGGDFEIGVRYMARCSGEVQHCEEVRYPGDASTGLIPVGLVLSVVGDERGSDSRRNTKSGSNTDSVCISRPSNYGGNLQLEGNMMKGIYSKRTVERQFRSALCDHYHSTVTTLFLDISYSTGTRTPLDKHRRFLEHFARAYWPLCINASHGEIAPSVILSRSN